MSVSRHLRQIPAPGERRVAFAGDTQSFRLTLDMPAMGSAWVRTNIGHAAVIRREIIEKIRDDKPALSKDWYDIPMARVSDTEFEVTLPLAEVGHFEAKCFYLEADRFDPLWPEGPNTALNVKPADLCAANIIYNAFVRQFGPNKDGSAMPTPEEGTCIQRLDAREYTVIPKSGTFRDLIRELDFIFDRLGCRILHLLPIHPTPTTYGRMGRFGSPYAALSFTAVDPALAKFDPKATPLDQFIELVDAVHARAGKIIIDIAPNHTGWAASLHETHPQWLARDPKGNIEVPGAWGVKWEDLTRLDYSHRELWDYMADVFLNWCRRGVDGFRCDAGYMIPVEAWRFIVAVVREQYPDTIFLLEGLGGKISVARDILNIANFDWAYSELFQNYDRGQIEAYLPGAIEISETDGLLVHYAETHDNNRLAARSHAWARMRTALCALFSHTGGFGFANGVEWLAADKIIVHESPSLNWGNPVNQIDAIGRLSRILTNHPAFRKSTRLRLIQTGPGNHVALLRHHGPTGKKLLIAVNLSDTEAVTASWSRCFDTDDVLDLLSGQWLKIETGGDSQRLWLEPGQVRCLSADAADAAIVDAPFDPNDTLRKQALKAAVWEIRQWLCGIADVRHIDIEQEIRLLADDPSGFCTRLAGRGDQPVLVPWHFPEDSRRIVMVPHGHGLLVLAEKPFRLRLSAEKRTVFQKNAIRDGQGRFFVVAPLAPSDGFRRLRLRMTVYERGAVQHATGEILCLPRGRQVRVAPVLHRNEIVANPPMFLATNGIGGMCRASVAWTALPSRYDALLAANLNPDYPEDRRILFTRCRGWVVFQGYSLEICIDCLDAFYRDPDGTGYWRFHVPSGQGEHILLTLGVRMPAGENAVELVFWRGKADGRKSTLPDHEPVQLVLRPDIEDRSFHDTTKAYLGPESLFPASVTPLGDGFSFQPEAGHRLQMRLAGGEFHIEPQWQYMVFRPLEAERGLDPHSDLFSPGYFTAVLRGGGHVRLEAMALRGAADRACRLKSTAGADATPVGSPPAAIGTGEGPALAPAAVLESSLNAYIVRRKPFASVIAGYPWFLDWGRDSLITVRGMVAAGAYDLARKMLLQFGRFEERGTLPNMIAGELPANRDTSDAPLWFAVAVRDLVRATGKTDFLDAPCGRRKIREVLASICRAYMEGTENGIRVDADSGLVFSPAHFTWMDTNYPACSPRQGYPVEIQALWHAAMGFMTEIDPSEKRWKAVSERVARSIPAYFWSDEPGHLADCLHADHFMPAAQAEADDALRPNQLLAVTLDAIADAGKQRSIVNACRALLVPGGIRSLADRPVRRAIEIRRNGQVLGDPFRPYRGRYAGDEDTSRKPAYHNGTAWGWQFPVFCEAWFKAYGHQARETALSYLSCAAFGLMQGCIGHLPEIMDGDAPHTARGCDAQAWSVSETLRVWRMLAHQEKPKSS
ncbi:amylo-alpha-1,6-glucosidase [Desulfatirhabdium butyrativorans]|uniref:amylo-alpha-1,6-glucosidase n=1 Tax=Desulfatirhabdium butyrativorans TaxID=340467 RepID=UPI0004067D45|nr:amylo-alpha-1,6-glucosidase [Desulfatirhabdium butyrativorans]